MTGLATEAAAPAPRRALYLRSWGCQMNAYDSDRMAELLAPLGYGAVASPDAADLVLLNTCHIREKADDKLYSELGRLRLVKRDRPPERPLLLAVAGCVAQAEGEEIARRAPWVDLVVGPQSYHRLPELLARTHRAAGTLLETAFPPESKFDHLPARPGTVGVSAFLTVQEGCDKFCSFCVVPYTRGAEASRPVAAVLAEARALLAGGARELTLLGQNVNAYRGAGPEGDAWSLAALLRAAAALPGLRRLRYTTSHPRDVDDALVAAHRDLPQLMPFLHLPVQSGSDRVLRAMNRGHDVAQFRRIVDRLRAARPDLALSSDFIVGHPGETAADHAATLALVREVGFAAAYSFAYSPRPGTPAAALPGAVPDAVKAERLAELQALLRAQGDAFAADLVGRTVPVLFTGPGRHPGQMAGRTPWQQPVHVDAAAVAAGEVRPVRLLAALTNSFSGALVASPATREYAPA